MSISGNIVKNRPNFFKAVAKWLIFTILTTTVPVIPAASAADIPASQWVSVPIKTDPMMQNLTIPTNASQIGMWSAVQSWPINGLHVAVLPDGRILSYGSDLTGNAQNGRYFDIWDSSLGFVTNSHQTTFRAQQQDSFCSTATFLNNGNLLISGGNGNKTSTLFSYSANSTSTPSAQLALSRWYATMINLPDGRPIMLGGMQPYSEGMVNDPDLAIAQGKPSMTPEVYENGAWRSLFGAYSRDAFGPDYLRTSYPRAWVAPNGKIFGISAEKMWYLDPSGNGSITTVGNFKSPYSAAVPINVGATSTAVMFAPGKILQLGGNGSFNGDSLPASNMATVVDINNETPVLTEQPKMSYARRFPNAIVLANGQVVVTGGTTFGNSGGSNTVLASEIWNPNTGNWITAASAAVLRVYHSQTTLMPNGTILSTGGGAPGPVVNLNAEIYYPPYLFKSVNGFSQLAARPVIKAISGLSYANNAAMQIDMASTNTISQLVLIGLSQGTHSFNTGQRRIPLSFTQDAIRLSTTIPNANLVPPGYYQVVALDATGVPSLGTIIAIGQNQTPPQVPLTPYTPPDLSGMVNAPVVNSGSAANYTITVLPGLTYSWNFGDGSPDTAYSTSATVSHTYTKAGAYVVTLSAKDSINIISRRTFMQAVATTKTVNAPTRSSPIVTETRVGNNARIWVVNPDNDSVSVMDATSKSLLATINVGLSPRSLAIAPDGRIWVVNKKSSSISIISPTTLNIVQTVNLPRASQPYGIAFAPANGSAFVVLGAPGQLVKLNSATGVQQGIASVGNNPRHVSISADGTRVLVSRFITPPMPGESTATVSITNASLVGAEVVVVNPTAMTISNTVLLKHSDKTDSENQGSGIPNYLGPAVISPDGTTAWVPSKQDNIKRGTLRNGQNLDFQNTVRAISSRINMATLTEDYAKRIDHDNSSVASAAVYHPSGVYMFVALETSRQVAVVDAIGGRELFKINVGRAPQGLTLSADGNTLYVHEFMDRSISTVDLSPLLLNGNLSARLSAVTYMVATEKLPAQIVLGKQLFYDAKDTRLARDSYMSCASCHNDGGHDGRVWDLTGFGEGLRNTISLKGRSGMGHGFLHWSANFDEIQDFEKQIRDLAGGLGLMTDAQFSTGTRSQPLGDRKAGLSTNLDELAGYVASLNTFENSPFRNTDGSLTTSALTGKALFTSKNCISCHTGNPFTTSLNASALKNIGTIKAVSGKRLNATLTGIDIPTLRDVWETAPYLHDGSAATLNAAIQSHSGISVTTTELNNLVDYLQQIGGEEVVNGTGLSGSYYATNNLTGNVVLQRSEAVNFNWGAGSPDARIPVDNFSVRWTGYVQATTAGAYQFQTNSDDGVRVYINDQLVIDNWTIHPPTLNNSTVINLAAGQLVPVTVEYFEASAGAVMQLSWLTPGATSFATIPIAQLYSAGQPAVNTAPTVSLTSPGNNVTYTQGAPYTITAVANDSDGTVTRVDILYNGENLLNSLTSAPYTISGSTSQVALGTYIITARAYDDKGAFTTSAPINITVSPPINNPPKVAITSPVNNVTLKQGDPYTITAAANDSDGTVTRVDILYNGENLLSSLTTAPYTISGSTAQVAVGTYSITARAYDNNGAFTTSAPLNVTVAP